MLVNPLYIHHHVTSLQVINFIEDGKKDFNSQKLFALVSSSLAITQCLLLSPLVISNSEDIFGSISQHLIWLCQYIDSWLLLTLFLSTQSLSISKGISYSRSTLRYSSPLDSAIIEFLPPLWWIEILLLFTWRVRFYKTPLIKQSPETWQYVSFE
jgi:hypothetical protein